MGTTVSLRGANFVPPLTVLFAGNVPAVHAQNANAKVINALVPQGALTGPIRVTTSDGVVLTASAFTVTPTPPSISSASTASGSVGVPFSYQIVASNTPTRYAVTGLMSSLTVNAATGLISGTPTAAGTFQMTLAATNGGGTTTAPLTVTIAANAPVITSATTASGTVNTAFFYQITASYHPTNFYVTGLPMGLSVNGTTGLISGTPTVPGTFNLTLYAYNGTQGSQPLSLTIAPIAPVITSATTATGTVGTAFSYQITAANYPTKFGVIGLKDGLTVNAATGVISGTPTTAATLTFTLYAYNAAGNGQQTLTVTISN